MILLINICSEEFHAFEFVDPVKAVINSLEIDFFERYYKEVNEKDLKKADKVIICGTSLKDNEFIKDLDCFLWLKDFNKPVLGICGGMQIIGLIFDGELKTETEIGFYSENFKKSFLGLVGNQEVYHLHNNYIDFLKIKDFDIYTSGKNVPQAIKHREKEIYGVLFHPEIRNKKLIINFINLS